MNRYLSSSLLVCILGFLPTLVVAQDTRLYAGTDQYLRNVVGLTDDQLSTKVDTLDREPFASLPGEQSVADPLGDVLHHQGASAQIQVPWADIRTVEVFQNDKTSEWDITVTTGGMIPEKPPGKAQFLFYTDRDTDTTNNDPDGIKGHMDQEFSVEFDPNDQAWIADFRWYNPEPVDFWAVDRNTAMTFTFSGDTLTLHIPYEELPTNPTPLWRAVIAVTDGGQTQVDVVPGIGYPPPKGEAYPEATYTSPEERKTASLIILLLSGSILMILASLFVIRKTTKQNAS